MRTNMYLSSTEVEFVFLLCGSFFIRIVLCDGEGGKDMLWQSENSQLKEVFITT